MAKRKAPRPKIKGEQPSTELVEGFSPDTPLSDLAVPYRVQSLMRSARYRLQASMLHGDTRGLTVDVAQTDMQLDALAMSIDRLEKQRDEANDAQRLSDALILEKQIHLLYDRQTQLLELKRRLSTDSIVNYRNLNMAIMPDRIPMFIELLQRIVMRVATRFIQPAQQEAFRIALADALREASTRDSGG